MDTGTLDLTAAFRIAVEVHGAQRDKAGEPYLFHVFRVAMAMETDEERVVALLHDAIEDTPGSLMNYTGFTQTEKFKRLLSIEILYGPDVSKAVYTLTRMDGEPYLDYIRRVAENPLAVKVKLADLRDNTDRCRLAKLAPSESARLRSKYYVAMDYLCENGALMPAPTASTSPHPDPTAQS